MLKTGTQKDTTHTAEATNTAILPSTKDRKKKMTPIAAATATTATTATATGTPRNDYCTVGQSHHDNGVFQGKGKSFTPLARDVGDQGQDTEGPRVHEEHHLVHRWFTSGLQTLLAGRWCA